MPEYLAPGVYVEETSFRSKSIEGVSTTTTGLIGPTRYGPVDLDPDIITSLGEFERVYGDGRPLAFSDGSVIDNYVWHAARAFFDQGGKRLYVVRSFREVRDDEDEVTDDGVASGIVPPLTDPPGENAEKSSIVVRARFPGEAGNLLVRFTLRLGQSVLGGEPRSDDPTKLNPTVSGLFDHDVVWIKDVTEPIDSPAGQGSFYLVKSRFDSQAKKTVRYFEDQDEKKLELSKLTANRDPSLGDQVRVVTVTVTVSDPRGETLPGVWENLPLDPQHERGGSRDSIAEKFAPIPSNLAQARTLPIVLTLGSDVATGLDVLQAMLKADAKLAESLADPKSSESRRSIDIALQGGSDGVRPGAKEYEGKVDDATGKKTGLIALEDIEDISIVAAPGSTYGLENGYRNDAMTIMSLLISHAERLRYRIAVLDSGNGQTIGQVRSLRAKFDSKYAALYYPWIRVLDPITGAENYLPPSGFVAGIYARNDTQRAVYKAPANETVSLAIGFEQLLNKAQQDVLNPEGINCFRYFEGRGFRLWGARTISSDPEWKYVNLRRYFIYLERSIDKGTQWAVFEPNGEALWANIRRTVEDFLLNEWQQGALLGDKPEKAYFVRCDRSTMTQNDIDNGRLVCLIGVAPLRPAEFVIFRIGQWTGDRRA